MPRQRALLIVNRKSLNGNTNLAAAVAVLRDSGLEVIERPIDEPTQVPETIDREGAAVDILVLGGGDGTMNIAAEALLRQQRPFGILPLGTANDLARTLQIPNDLPEAAEVILRGRRHQIDLGRVNDKHFFNVASLGLSVEVSRYHQGERKRRWKVFGYIFSIIDAYRETRPFRARLHFDGRMVSLRCIQVSIGNGRHYGGGMTVAAEATIDDQLLHVVCLKPQSLWQLAILFPALRSGRRDRRDRMEIFSARDIRVETRRRKRINTDGELTAWTPARFSVVPRALTVLVPDSYRPNGTQ